MSIMNFSEENGTNYSLTCVNNSSADWVFYIYQKMPNQPKEVFSLAWFASPYKISSGDQITFHWSINYSFVWGDTGTLKPGITYNASGKKSCSPDGNNQTTFSMNDNTPQLSIPIPGGQAGSLTIHEDGNIPNNKFSTGIGMSGQGTFVQQGLQNIDQVYTPEPVYYIAAAQSIQMGCVLAQSISKSQQVVFDANIYSLTATLGSDQLWTISN